MFLSSWAELARSPPQPITPLPSFRRSCFNPRRPIQPHKSLDKLYAPLSCLPPPPPPSDHNNHNQLTSRIYLIKSESVDLLQSQSTSNGTKRSKIESFSAFLWKTLAGGGGGDRRKTVKLGVVIDGRTRLSGRSTPMDRYFGNVLSIPYIEATVADLKTASLKELASRVHGCVAAWATADHFLGLIDWVEMRRPKSAVARVYCKDESDECAVVVSSGLRFPVLELDFGSGRPVFGSYHFPWGGETGYVMPMLSACGNGDWVVYMHLMQEQLDLVEARASHVFRPFHLILPTVQA